jgi:putative ABC transport system permease protein
MFQDIRFGLRMMWQSRSLTLLAMLSLALGIGANTAIFSVVNVLLLKPLPYREPERLMKVAMAVSSGGQQINGTFWAYPRFEIVRDQNESFTTVAGYTPRRFNLTGTDEPEQLQIEMVSAGYFPLLRLDAVAGRVFSPEEESAAGEPPVAMLSYALWQRRFGGDPNIAGKTLELEKKAFTITGVAPPEFRGQEGVTDVWLPMVTAPAMIYPRILVNANNFWFQVIARLKPGVTRAQAEAELSMLGGRIESAFPSPKQLTLPESMKQPTPLVSLREANVDPTVRRSFLILLAAVGFVLLIACANIANLLMARAVKRRKEFAVRLALGAGRGRIIRQLLTESAMLALVSGLLGLFVAYWCIAALNTFKPLEQTSFWSHYARTFDFFSVQLDGRVLGFNFLIALLTGILFGLLPAWQASRPDVNDALKEGIGAAGNGRFRGFHTRNLLVVAELALSLVLLAGAGLMLRTLWHLQQTALNFAPEQVLTMSLPSRTLKTDFYEQVLTRVQSLPGVESASISSTAPLLGRVSATALEIEGRTLNEAQAQDGIGFHSVSPDYFRTLGIRLLRGRFFTEQDRVGAPRVAIINQAAADLYFPSEDPLGKRLIPAMGADYKTDEKAVEIVGIVDDVKYGSIEEAAEPELYCSFLQPTDMANRLTVRSRLAPAELMTAIKREVQALNSDVPLLKVQTMSERVAEVTSRPRFIALLLSLFATLALLLSGIGIYGVIAYGVSTRTRELGVRMALGAQGGDILRLVLRDGLLLIVAGLGSGLFAAWATVRLLRSQLYEVSVSDPITFAAVAVLLALVALLACYLPARRATKVDPLSALRHE